MTEPPLRLPLHMRDIQRIRTEHETHGDFTTPAIECPYCGCSLLVHRNGAVVCSNVGKPVCESLSKQWQLAIVEKGK